MNGTSPFKVGVRPHEPPSCLRPSRASTCCSAVATWRAASFFSHSVAAVCGSQTASMPHHAGPLCAWLRWLSVAHRPYDTRRCGVCSRCVVGVYTGWRASSLFVGFSESADACDDGYAR